MELSEGTKTTNYNVSKKYIQKPNRNNWIKLDVT